jgi:hypothetical protein
LLIAACLLAVTLTLGWAVPSEAKYELRSSACAQKFHQAKFEKYARAVWKRDKVSRKAKDRLVRMRKCMHSSAARKNARRLNRRLRQRHRARKTAPIGSPIPSYIWKCESGGDYNAVNPSSGARGRYQIMPFHYTSGICRGLDWSPRGQDICAARIWESSGPGAWECA